MTPSPPEPASRPELTDPTASTETTELHVAYPTTPPDFVSFDVKALTPETLLGAPCTVAVVGQSHVVTAPALSYHEVCSCVPQSVDTSETVALDSGVTARVQTDDGRETAATTEVAVRPLDAFPGADDATIAYRFGPEAWTTVSLHRERASYETYHTYPERDVVVHTTTRLTEPASDRDPAHHPQERDR